MKYNDSTISGREELRWWISRRTSSSSLFYVYLFILKERERKRQRLHELERDRERQGERESQGGSVLSVKSPVQGLIQWNIIWPWAEIKSHMINQLSHTSTLACLILWAQLDKYQIILNTQESNLDGQRSKDWWTNCTTRGREEATLWKVGGAEMWFGEEMDHR